MDRTLLEIFTAEQTEHLQRIRSSLDLLPSAGENRGALFEELLRRAHTLKGASRAVGLESTERLIHRMESVFAKWQSQASIPDPAGRAAIHRVLDGAEDILAWALGTRTQPDEAALLQSLDPLLIAGPLPAAGPDDVPAVPPQKHVPAQSVPIAPPVEQVRVDTALLDDVMRSASQLVHAMYTDHPSRSRAAQHARFVEQAFEEYSRLRRNCNRFIRQNSHVPEFRPVADCFEFIDRQFRQVLTGARSAAAQQDSYHRALQLRVDDVHDRALRARMTPAQTVFGAFGAMVRDLAAQEGKQIAFTFEGAETQADREVLQALKDPVMHILRNSVSHGIEMPHEREAAGKTQSGVVRLRIQTRGDRLLIVASDDGKGLDTKALAERAVRQGLLSDSAAQTAAPDALARLIFEPGMTTSAAVTRLAGRGMGLSTVAQAVNTLHGDVRVRTRAGRGVTIAISVPLSISSQHVLLVREGGSVFGLPAAFVDRLWRFRPSDVRVIDGAESIVVEDRPVPLLRLSEVLGLGVKQQADETQPSGRGPTYQAAILASGDERAAIVVEVLVDERETLVKDTGLAENEEGWSAGAVVLEDGSVAVMLSVARLLQSVGAGGGTTFQPPPRAVSRSRILVVDDSVTTRTMEKSILEAHDYDVKLAVDGIEALQAIQEDRPDLVISDVSMPRMDGFQLLEKIKSDKSTAAIPVILVTSLESREEQEKGLSLGADAYIVKRKFDQRELLRIVRQIL